MAEGYLFIVGVLALSAIMLIGLLANVVHKHLRRKPSVVADRTAARRQREASPQRLRDATSPTSYRRGSEANRLAREDSPLLGPEPILHGEEKKEGMGSWNSSSMGGDEEMSRALGNETGGPRSNSPGRKTMVPAALSAVGANDEALLSTFAEVMSEGLPVKILKPSGRAKKVMLRLKDRDTLLWFSRRALGAIKWRKISLREVTEIQAGSGSEPFGNANDVLCLRLVLRSAGCLGLEASSELERDALVQGLSMLVQELKDGEHLEDA